MAERREWEVLKVLAYDLDFYEPDPNLRAESAAYYGNQRVEQEIITALEKIRHCHTSNHT